MTSLSDEPGRTRLDRWRLRPLASQRGLPVRPARRPRTRRQRLRRRGRCPQTRAVCEEVAAPLLPASRRRRRDCDVAAPRGLVFCRAPAPFAPRPPQIGARNTPHLRGAPATLAPAN